MKRKSIIALLISAFSFGMVSTSCEDMLSPDSARHSYVVAQDTLYSYWGIVKSLQNVAERYVVLGECRGDLVSGTAYVSDTIKAILDYDMAAATDGSCRFLKASDYYHVINSCNAYLANCDTLRMTGTLQPYMVKEAAQVYAIRAWVYLQLVQVYGEVPFYTEPLLTTDQIDAFMKNHPKVNASNLVDNLREGLEWAQQVEMQYGYPQYNVYKGNNDIHSSKCMIPVNVILADLYLTKGDAASCRRAAQYYYDYFSGNQDMSLVPAGGALPQGYYYTGKKSEGENEAEYEKYSGTPWTEYGKQARAQEAVTAIPSSTNKLWGNVLRGVNELFGFESRISVQTNMVDTTAATSASVTLIPTYYTKQLYASKGYFQQANSQKFDTYISTDLANINAATEPVVDPSVGDARQYWAQSYKSRQTYENGVTNLEKFVHKQNPSGVFSSIYPLIYRKGQLWLRFAEALNRAGFPSYAFAILRNGLCNNPNYYPVADSEDYADVYNFHYTFVQVDEEGKKDTIVVPAVGEANITSMEALIAAVREKVEDEEYELAKTGIDSVYDPELCTNYPNANTNKVLFYLDRREVAQNAPFLNFSLRVLDGNYMSQPVMYSPALSSRRSSIATVTIASTDNDPKGTIGIHARGCGLLYPGSTLGSYNYVDKVIEKAALYGKKITKEDIYSGDYDALVQDCVEDLIIDEAAMELAFEGNRFFDLMRVAQRRGNPEYLASRVAMRDGALDGKLYSKLLNEKNWFFPLPR